MIIHVTIWIGQIEIRDRCGEVSTVASVLLLLLVLPLLLRSKDRSTWTSGCFTLLNRMPLSVSTIPIICADSAQYRRLPPPIPFEDLANFDISLLAHFGIDLQIGAWRRCQVSYIIQQEQYCTKTNQSIVIYFRQRKEKENKARTKRSSSMKRWSILPLNNRYYSLKRGMSWTGPLVLPEDSAYKRYNVYQLYQIWFSSWQ